MTDHRKAEIIAAVAFDAAYVYGATWEFNQNCAGDVPPMIEETDLYRHCLIAIEHYNRKIRDSAYTREEAILSIAGTCNPKITKS